MEHIIDLPYLIWDRFHSRADLFTVAREATLSAMCRVAMPSLKISVQRVGEYPKSGAFIIAANHSSHFDTPAIIASMNKKEVAKLKIAASTKYFFRSKSLLRKVAIKLFSLIPASGRELIRTTRTLALNGNSLLIYPEGTRSRDGKIGSFRAGVGAIHRSSGIPIVPVTIIGSKGIMDVGSYFPKSGDVEVIIGSPIEVSGLDSETIARIVEKRVKEQRDAYLSQRAA